MTSPVPLRYPVRGGFHPLAMWLSNFAIAKKNKFGISIPPGKNGRRKKNTTWGAAALGDDPPLVAAHASWKQRFDKNPYQQAHQHQWSHVGHQAPVLALVLGSGLTHDGHAVMQGTQLLLAKKPSSVSLKQKCQWTTSQIKPNGNKRVARRGGQQALNNECVGRLLPQCPLSWAGAVEQESMCYNMTKCFGTGKVMRRKLRSTKKWMVHSACSWRRAPWELIENEEFCRAGAQTFTNHVRQAAARSSIAQPTGAGVQEARRPLRQLGDKSDNDIPENPLQAKDLGGHQQSKIPSTRQAQNLRILLHLW